MPPLVPVMLAAVTALGFGTLLVGVGLLAAAPRDDRCPACGHPRRGIAGAACPECGRTADAPLTATRRLRRRIAALLHRRRRGLADAGLALMMIMPVTLGTLIVDRLLEPPRQRAFLLRYGVHAEGVAALALAMPPGLTAGRLDEIRVPADADPDALGIELRARFEDGRTVRRPVDGLTTAGDVRRWLDREGITPALRRLADRPGVAGRDWSPDRFAAIVAGHVAEASARRFGVFRPTVLAPAHTPAVDGGVLRGAGLYQPDPRRAAVPTPLVAGVLAGLAAVAWLPARGWARRAIARREREERDGAA